MSDLYRKAQVTIDGESILENPFNDYDLEIAANDNECTVDEFVEMCDDVWLIQLKMIDENTFQTLDEYVGAPSYHSGFSEISFDDGVNVVYATIPFNLLGSIGASDIIDNYVDWF